MMEIENNIRRSEEVQDVVGQMPPWLIRFGTIIVAITFLVFLLLSIFISYPDTLSGQTEITTDSPPVSLVARTDGKIHFLFKEGKFVEEEDYIAYVENDAAIEGILVLKSEIKKLEEFAYAPEKYLGKVDIKEIRDLGEVQGFYNNFLRCWSDFEMITNLKINSKKIESLNLQNVLLRERQSILGKKKEDYFTNLTLVNRRLSSDSLLVKDGAISPIELEGSKQRQIDVLKTYHDIKEDLVVNRKLMLVNEGEVESLLADSIKLFGSYCFQIQECYDKLHSAYRKWEETYVLKSPVSGKLSYFDLWTNNQKVMRGQDIAYVVSKKEALFARMKVEGAGIGKAKVGQKVKIKLDGFPADEFGLIIGSVKSISQVNSENFYSVVVLLPKGLKTTYGKELVFLPEMKGKGDIITEKSSLLGRVFNKISSVNN